MANHGLVHFTVQCVMCNSASGMEEVNKYFPQTYKV